VHALLLGCTIVTEHQPLQFLPACTSLCTAPAMHALLHRPTHKFLQNQMESPDFLPELGTIGRMTLTGLCSEVRWRRFRCAALGCGLGCADRKQPAKRGLLGGRSTAGHPLWHAAPTSPGCQNRNRLPQLQPALPLKAWSCLP